MLFGHPILMEVLPNFAFSPKDLGGIMLNCLLENEAQQTVKELHQGVCGGHHKWKVNVNKIMRAGYWPTIFSDVYKEVTTCHECQIFYGKRKLMPLPLNAFKSLVYEFFSTSQGG